MVACVYEFSFMINYRLPQHQGSSIAYAVKKLCVLFITKYILLSTIMMAVEHCISKLNVLNLILVI